MEIPKIIHQTWKTQEIPRRWKKIQQQNQFLHSDYEYHLWTDEEMNEYVKIQFNSFYVTFQKFTHSIFRADVFRYLIMYTQGGIYLDLDYELLFPFSETQSVVLPKERSIAFGDGFDRIGNCFFASVPGHPFWKDAIGELQNNFPLIKNEFDAITATGPVFLNRIYESKSYTDIYCPERMVYHPPIPLVRKDYEAIKSNGITKGIHHGWGSWKNRSSWRYWKRKAFGQIN